MRSVTANRIQRFFLKALGLPPNVASITPLNAGQGGSQFPAGAPFGPAVINPPDVSGKPPARAYDFPTMLNIRYRPDAERMTAYQILRWISDNHLITRAAINLRKKEIVGLDWDIVPPDKNKTGNEADRIALKKFWMKPDGLNPFSQWLNNGLEDLFVLDAMTFEKRLLRNGDLYGLDVIDGATIHILLDDTGRLPRPPAPAYQQVLKGYPRANFTLDELIYDPYNNTPDSPYGTSFMEAAQLEINALLRLMTFTLAYFTEGNTPEGFLDVANDLATPDSIRQFQEIYDAALVGVDAQRRRIRVIPKGSQYQPVRDVQFAQYVELDRMLVKKVLMAYEVQPHEVGLTEDVNKATGNTQENITYRRAIKPLVGYLQDIFNDIIHGDMEIADWEFRFSGYEIDDELTRAQIHQIYAQERIMTKNEIRGELELDPVEGGDDLSEPPAPAPFYGASLEEQEKELAVWERKALNDLGRNGNGRAFISDILSSPYIAEVEAGLKDCTDAMAVKSLFADVKKKLQANASGKGRLLSSKRIFPNSPRFSAITTKNGGRASLQVSVLRNPY